MRCFALIVLSVCVMNTAEARLSGEDQSFFTQFVSRTPYTIAVIKEQGRKMLNSFAASFKNWFGHSQAIEKKSFKKYRSGLTKEDILKPIFASSTLKETETFQLISLEEAQEAFTQPQRSQSLPQLGPVHKLALSKKHRHSLPVIGAPLQRPTVSPPSLPLSDCIEKNFFTLSVAFGMHSFPPEVHATFAPRLNTGYGQNTRDADPYDDSDWGSDFDSDCED